MTPNTVVTMVKATIGPHVKVILLLGHVVTILMKAAGKGAATAPANVNATTNEPLGAAVVLVQAL